MLTTMPVPLRDGGGNKFSRRSFDLRLAHVVRRAGLVTPTGRQPGPRLRECESSARALTLPGARGGNASCRVIELEAMPFVNQVYARTAFASLRFNQEDTHSMSAAVAPNMARVLPVSGVRVSSVN